MSDLLINNKNNYYEKYKNIEYDIYINYLKIVTEYVEQLEKINYINSKNNDILILQGLNTITNVFKILILYTKNLDLTIIHSKKSIYYYVEFINQIDIDNNFIKLTSTDASLFIYKKTIYLIDNEFRKNYISKYYNIENNIYLFIEILKFNFENLITNILIYNDLKNKYNILFSTILNIIDITCNSNSKDINKNLNIIYQFNNLIVSLNINNYNKLLNLFCIKKVYNLCKIKNLKNIILNNIDIITDDKLDNNNLINFIINKLNN